MKHGRKDYQRIQDPAADESLLEAYREADAWLQDDDRDTVAQAPVTRLDALTAALKPILGPVLAAPPAHPIAIDEPVFLLRASDKIAPAIVREYANRLRQEGGGTWDHATAVVEQAKAMEVWQSENRWKLPDAPQE